MALTKKLSNLLELNGDIIAVQECSAKAIALIDQEMNLSATWQGSNPNKGLGVIVRSPWRINVVEHLPVTWATFLKLSGPIELNVIAVWACAAEQHRQSYIGQIHLLLDYLDANPAKAPTVIMGDFNSNAIWDSSHKETNHSRAVDRLCKLGLVSSYHKYFKEEQGRESNHTLCLLKNRMKQYHIDYVFIADQLADKISSVSIGDFDEWIKHSDHAPITVDLNLKRPNVV